MALNKLRPERERDPLSEPHSHRARRSAINDEKHGSQNIQSSRTGQGAKGRKKTTTVSCPVTWIGAKGARFRTGYRDFA